MTTPPEQPGYPTQPPPGYGPPPPYGQQWQGYPAPSRNGFGVTALVLGILALVFGLIPFAFFLSIPLGVTGIVFGVLGRNRAARGEANNRGMATAGFVCAIIGVVVSILWIAALVIGVTDGTCRRSSTFVNSDGQTTHGISVRC